jgi:uncharacterized membrane protein
MRGQKRAMKRSILAMIGLGIIFLTASCGAKNRMAVENGQVTIPVSEVNDGKAHHYSISLGGKEISFFVLESNDGVIRAAFDACDVCFPAKKGYSQDGDYMICNNCGRAFHESKINVEKGGCNPAPLDRSFDESVITIAVSDIAKGSVFF